LPRIIRTAGGIIVEGNDPAKLPRAVKNSVEINGSAAAHLQDGAAMVEFLCWLSQTKPGTVTEIEVAEKLEAARAQGRAEHAEPAEGHFLRHDLRCRRACGDHALPGDDGKQPDARSGRTVPDRFRGAVHQRHHRHYPHGGVGTVSEEQKRFFTLVLKGMIQISTARFPKGTRGCDLDPLARIALWRAGADFGHGTGHGVGSYLSVHEGPQRISRMSTQELLPGMILSNEPGYYRPGAFGIRIENLIYVREPEWSRAAIRRCCSFETLTFCPIDRNLVIPELLDP
jgi:Xaa-Pro aminopeptidase